MGDIQIPSAFFSKENGALDNNSAKKQARVTIAGYMQVAAAMLYLMNTINSNLANGLQPLSLKLNQINESNTNNWMTIMDGQLTDMKNYINAHSNDKDFNGVMNEKMTEFNLTNTKYQKDNTFYSNLVTAADQDQSDTSQTFNLANQNYDMGPLSIIQTLVQVI